LVWVDGSGDSGDIISLTFAVFNRLCHVAGFPYPGTYHIVVVRKANFCRGAITLVLMRINSYRDISMLLILAIHSVNTLCHAARLPNPGIYLVLIVGKVLTCTS
jgi:hypothetical protein